ncbi:peptidase M23 [Desulfitobacterium metallireducens DSM 15288]|uniref:Peptidase M23 n=1 Tax=Desulfitobacterium metallireducens DSM 15288 TaxID=871968 RepID=W0EGF0_9FIRM|nr:peptidase M23 [Desulfitobacterium metallireducens DSM 15288]
MEDFPSPVRVEPLRGVENYFSENVNAYLFHAGRDYPLVEGAVIRATHGGKVTFAGADPILGQKVEIDCGEGWRVVYGGLDNLRVQQGEIIENNTVLGQIGYYSGADGINDRTQLHYEVWNGDQAQAE